MNQITILSIISVVTTFTLSPIVIYYLIVAPQQDWAKTDTMAKFNSTNTCTELVLLNANLDEGLEHGDYLHFQNLIKQKSEEMKCP